MLRRPGLRYRAAWQATKDGFTEWFVYGDRGAARTSWGYAWTYLRAPIGELPGEGTP